MKSFIIICVILFTSFVCLAYGQSNHIQWGNVDWSSRATYNETVNKTYQFLQIITLDVQFPPPVSLFKITSNFIYNLKLCYIAISVK